jgi:hypothetical protein
MAVGKCKQCSGMLASSAKACPHCGAVVRKTSVVTWLLLAIFAFPVLGMAVAAFTPDTPEQIAEDTARKAIAAEAYKRDMAIIAAERSVKAKLKDPESAQFSPSVYTSAGYVCGSVNARNSFGAYSGTQAFLMPENGVGARVDDGSASFSEIWQKHCG